MPDRGHEIVAVGVVFLTASWAVFLLRLCSRLRLFKQFKVDDWSLVIVQVGVRTIIQDVYLACQIGGAVHGSGRRQSTLTETERARALKWWYLTFLSYILTTCALKVSVGIFLIRIAVNRRHLIVLHVLTWGTLAFGIPYGIMMAVQCRPIHTFWNASPRTPGKCWDYKLMETFTHVASALNCFADWVFGIIPFLIVRSLNIARPTKALVAWLLCFAAIGSIATIVRTFFIPQMLLDHDFLYDTVDLCIWSTVEVGVGVLAWSAATCRPIHRYFLARLQAWPWIGGDRFRGQRCESKEPFAHFPVRDLKLRPDEYFHESRCSSNGGSSAIRSSKRKGSIFVTAQEVRGSLSLAEEGGITKTLELSQISSRRDALFPPLPEAAHMPNHLTPALVHLERGELLPPQPLTGHLRAARLVGPSTRCLPAAVQPPQAPRVPAHQVAAEPGFAVATAAPDVVDGPALGLSVAAVYYQDAFDARVRTVVAGVADECSVHGE
ncbi:hypothetical protein PG989_011838 [Apiospora arundinis]